MQQRQACEQRSGVWIVRGPADAGPRTAAVSPCPKVGKQAKARTHARRQGRNRRGSVFSLVCRSV